MSESLSLETQHKLDSLWPAITLTAECQEIIEALVMKKGLTILDEVYLYCESPEELMRIKATLQPEIWLQEMVLIINIHASMVRKSKI